MTLPKGEKHHFIIQCDSHPLSLSNMPYVPVAGRLARISGVTGLFTHGSQSDAISCRKKKSIRHHSAVTGCQAEGIDPHRPPAQGMCVCVGGGVEARGQDGRCGKGMYTPNAQSYW